MAIAKSKIFHPKKKLMVAAIDFGTTFSGWAFSFVNEYQSDPTKISCKQWCSGKNISSKAPTTVLIQPDGKTLEAFGYEAEDRYAELADEGEYKRYYYFERFKMLLFDNKNLTRNEELEDDKGKRLPAKRVFTMVIKYLKDDLLEESKRKLAGALEDEEIQWVLTVPAIWSPPAKQFMRECAVGAGMLPSTLCIALEPEAASLYCRYQTIQKEKDGNADASVLSAFKPGARYMVVDAGGGTVDIVVHEVCDDKTLKEIYQANGGKWGGTMVDKAFQDFLTRIVGRHVIERFKNEHKDDFLDLQREFEVKKRSIKPSLKSKVRLKLPVSLSEIYKDVNSESVMKGIEKDKELNGRVNFMADKALFDCSLLKDLFNFTNVNLLQHLENIFKTHATTNTNTILMVGGFSESPMLFEAVKRYYNDKNVLVPENAGVAVLKGAVIFGHERKNISVRISQFTYGFEMNKYFDPNIHPKDVKILQCDGQKLVRGCFEKLIDIGEEMPLNGISRKHEVEPEFDHTYFILTLYASQAANPLFVHEPGCFKIGEIHVDCKDDKGKVGGVIVQLKFGGTEFEIQAILEATGKETKATFSFLD